MAGRADVKFTGDERALVRAVGRAQAAQRRLGDAGEEAGRKTAKGASEAEDALDDMNEASGTEGPEALGNLTAKFAGAAIAIGIVKEAFDEVVESFERGQQALAENIDGLNRVAALTSATTEQSLQEVVDLPGLFDLRTKAAINFIAQSQGVQDKEGLFREVEAARVLGEQPLQFAESLIGLRGTPLGEFGIPQISSFLQQAALQSPLDISSFAPVFGRVAGVAGGGAENQASAAAVLSSLTGALGGTQNAALRASQALQGFLAKRLDPKAEKLFEQAGVDINATIGQQLLSLADVFQDPTRGGFSDQRDFKRQFIQAFGQNAGSKILSLLGSPAQLSKIEPVTGQLVGALESDSDISSLRVRAAELEAGSPTTRANNRRRRAQLKREEQDIRRGESQAEIGATQEEALAFLENEDVSRGTGSKIVSGLSNSVLFLLKKFVDGQRLNEREEKKLREESLELLKEGNADRKDGQGSGVNATDGDGDSGG